MNQPAHSLWLVDWLAGSDVFSFLFLVFGFQKSLLNFTRLYIRNDLGLVFNVGICFVMVFGAYAAK